MKTKLSELTPVELATYRPDLFAALVQRGVEAERARIVAAERVGVKDSLAFTANAQN